ncbi:PHD finger protein [Glycine soja]|nr:PHD finger protein [Glycine soja]
MDESSVDSNDGPVTFGSDSTGSDSYESDPSRNVIYNNTQPRISPSFPASPSPSVFPAATESGDSSPPSVTFPTPNQLQNPHRLKSLLISVPSVTARMKGGRSHRPRSSAPPDEWVDGSWTVDCICGVTFDDGEEMVKCDECGVWVHTRCSRYVKGDDTFSCDKCKARHNKNNTTTNNSNNNSNSTTNPMETEVAQFLVELPTKTISMDNKKALPSRPRLWTDKPIEERVHVQGPPEPSLPGSGSGLTIPEGVPAKDGNNNDNGVGVSKEANNTAAAPPVAPSVETRSGHAKDADTGKFGSQDVPPRVHGDVKKERTLLRPPVVHNSKRSKGDLGNSSSKERIGKKRLRTSDREVDSRKRTLHSSKSAFTPTGDGKQLDFYEDRGSKMFKADARSIKNKNLKDMVVQEHVSDDPVAVDTIMEESNNNLTTTEDSSEPLYPDMTKHGVSVGDVVAEEKASRKTPTLVEMSSKTDDAVTSALKQNYVGNASVKEKDGDCLVADNADDALVVRSAASPRTEGHCVSAPELVDNQVSQDLGRNMRPSSAKCKVKMGRDDNVDNFRKPSNFHSSPISDHKNNEKPSDHTSDIVKVNDAPVPSLPSCESKVGGVDISSELIPADHTNKPIELSGDFCQRKLEPVGSEGSLETQKGFSETKDGLDAAKDPSKSEALGCSPKVGKSSPTSSTMNSKSLGHDCRSEDTEIPNSFTKHGVMADSNIHTKNENCPSVAARDENSKKSVKERPKSSLNSNSKGLHSSRSVQNSVSKQVNSDARDSVHVLSSKPLIHQTASILGSSESNHQKVLQVQSKISSSAPQKVEKLNQTNIHTSSKLNQSHVPSVNPSLISNSSMLSDEELALLLHQELNSSPRVPRVPRARHAGSLPQLTSASATSMLMKRTSGGGKDHYFASRRKHKDASRDGSGSSRELEYEAKRIEKEKGPSSSDQRKQDMSYAEDAPAREEGLASMAAANSITNNTVSSTSGIANSDASTPPEDQNLSSMRNSPRNVSDDDTATAGRPVHRTLPGLINDIMSKGRRMTYEELCNAVLPHWHNLRKHNGERYAYSSHSQAVLDCLRNRHEWARLVDRGPKTNSNRKRRKLDAEESDDNGYGKGRTAKDVEGKNFELQKEEFPKGKRKARKRRRLALQGRAVKDVRRRQKADSLTDEDLGPFSNSSEESMFSEDEIQAGRIRPAGSSSDEAGSA